MAEACHLPLGGVPGEYGVEGARLVAAVILVRVDIELTNVPVHGILAAALQPPLGAVHRIPDGIFVQAAVDGLDDAAVLQGHHLDAELAALGAVAEIAGVLGPLKAHHRHGTQTRDVDDGAQGVGAVEGGVHIVAPVVLLAIGDGVPDGLAVVDVLPLAVLELADLALFIELLHLVGSGHIAVVLAVGVDQTALLHGLHQLHGLLHVLDGEHLREDVETLLETADGEGGVLVGVVGQHHGVHVVLNEIVESLVEGDIQPLGGGSLGVQSLGTLVADSHHLGVVGSLAVVDHAGAAVGAQDADAYFFHGVLPSVVNNCPNRYWRSHPCAP